MGTKSYVLLVGALLTAQFAVAAPIRQLVDIQNPDGSCPEIRNECVGSIELAKYYCPDCKDDKYFPYQFSIALK